MHDAQRLLSARRRAPEAFNVLVAGRRGVGKSTFLQTLCDSFPSLRILGLEESGNSRMLFDGSEEGEELLDPFCVFDALSGTTAIRRCRVQVQDEERQQPVSMELIDTPGIDDHDAGRASSAVNEISWEIERRLRASVDEEIKTRRDRGAQRAAHIHAVVYMVAPPVYSSATTDAHSHRLDAAVDILTDTDVMAIRSLGKLTNVIVVVGKSDTIEAGDRAMLHDGSFLAEAEQLVAPGRLFGFRDLPGTQKEPEAHVDIVSQTITGRMPLLLCGSKHVDEWQRMRLPEYQASSRSRLTISDWRTLATPHNNICQGSAVAGIFRNRRTRGSGGSSSRSDSNNSGNSGDTVLPHSMHSLAQDDDTTALRPTTPPEDSVRINRMGQRREVSLVRKFAWGTLQLNNIWHCDFALLSDVLVTSFRRSLVCWTDNHFFESYRMQRVAADPAYNGVARDMATYLEHQHAEAALDRSGFGVSAANTQTTLRNPQPS
ncbi:hypothetical protein GGF46_000518 [Coemansia sp. RSA 552]|nr:hypothetical protein GGF46_000518 [Coemansia sp. RSA 552]